MSWQTRAPNQIRRRSVEADIRSTVGRVVASLLALLSCASSVHGQENPLRDGVWGGPSSSPVETGNESGYLEQLLPSLQKIQADSPSSTPPQPNPEASVERLASGALVPGTEAGVWPVETETGALSAKRETGSLPGQTETRLLDSRPTAWGDPGTPEALAESASAQLRTSGLLGSSATRSAKGSTASASNRLAAFQGVESLQLNSTLVKVGLNTLLVLAATVGLIMVVRKSLPRQQPNQQRPVGRLRIEQSLCLGGKAELKVVRCGLNQVLVAIDGGGIRSVVALEPALEAEREHLEPTAASNQPPVAPKEPVNIEQFVKMIKDMEGDFMAARTGR